MPCAPQRGEAQRCVALHSRASVMQLECGAWSTAVLHAECHCCRRQLPCMSGCPTKEARAQQPSARFMDHNMLPLLYISAAQQLPAAAGGATHQMLAWRATLGSQSWGSGHRPRTLPHQMPPRQRGCLGWLHPLGILQRGSRVTLLRNQSQGPGQTPRTGQSQGPGLGC
jgi:hypothetical protein